jgi:hypothetical protein
MKTGGFFFFFALSGSIDFADRRNYTHKKKYQTHSTPLTGVALPRECMRGGAQRKSVVCHVIKAPLHMHVLCVCFGTCDEEKENFRLSKDGRKYFKWDSRSSYFA